MYLEILIRFFLIEYTIKLNIFNFYNLDCINILLKPEKKYFYFLLFICKYLKTNSKFNDIYDNLLIAIFQKCHD